MVHFDSTADHDGAEEIDNHSINMGCKTVLASQPLCIFWVCLVDYVFVLCIFPSTLFFVACSVLGFLALNLLSFVKSGSHRLRQNMP